MGYQVILFAMLTKIYAQHEGFNIPRSRSFDRLEARISLRAGPQGLFLFLVGLGIAIWQFSVCAASASRHSIPPQRPHRRARPTLS